MTDKQLQGLAMQALNLAKQDMQYKRWRGFLIATYHEGETLHRMRKIEALIIERAGDEWMNDGHCKDEVYGLIRACMKLSPAPPDAVVFVNAINRFIETSEFRTLPREEQERIIDGGHDGHHKAAAQGYMELQDCFMALAQTPEKVCLCTHQVAGTLLVGQPDIKILPQEQWDGRTKMFGEGKHCVDLDLEQMLREKAMRDVQ